MSSDNLVLCNACGHLVPEDNLVIHQVHACLNRSHAASSRKIGKSEDRGLDAPRETGNNYVQQQQFDAKATQQQHHQQLAHVHEQAREHAQQISQSYQTAQPSYHSRPDFIDLTGGRQQQQQQQQNDGMLDDDDDEPNWACPRCTLFNRLSESSCVACNYRRRDANNSNNQQHDDSESIRAPDSFRREQLIPDNPWMQENAAAAPGLLFSNTSTTVIPSLPPSSSMIVGSGAFLGGVLGAATAFFGSRSMTSGVLQGAVTGAVGAAIAQEVMQHQRNNNQQPTDVAAARSSASIGMPSYPSLGSSARRASATRGGAQPRSSMRIIRSTGPGGSTQISLVQHGGDNAAGLQEAESLLAALNQIITLHGGGPGAAGLLLAGGAGGHNIDNMSYDQLLDAFGNGMEHRGADEAVIQSLPTATLQDPQRELPTSLQTCPICLEAFEKGQMRKCLPCLHGFHQECVDTWLRSNGSCPICKHNISSE